ncbi:dienelactone hydrolase family protein [Paenibacillus sp.]|uniref:alpha/beta hydrolase family protein n=1 Tax=Paenibacillus sp. TaxID=58172 RepID=UPI0028116DBB|nr:dienelactone hydrolase family protein [Paenibacillus sp.]
MKYKISELHAGQVPPLTSGMDTDAAAAWAKRRAEIEAAWQEYIGFVPEPVDPEPEVLETVQVADHVRVRLRYATGFGDKVPAYLLIPGGDPSPARKLPAVLALHPTHASGKDDVASSAARENRAYGLELVRRGYVVLAPDTISMGERIYEGEEAFRTAPFYAAHPSSTAVGKMLHDHRQSLDVLTALPYVDASRIGAIGHSLGGYNAFFLAGVDRRVKAVVSSCGFATFAGDPDPNRWGQRDWFSHLPKISDSLAAGFVPFEYHEIAALAAPTPFFNWNGMADKIFPHWRPAAEALTELGALYRALDAEHRLEFLFGNSGHDFPPTVREAAYVFLDRWLKGNTAGTDDQ